jgi:hypothetical protein
MLVIVWPFVYWSIGMPYVTIDGFVTSSYNFTGFLANVFWFERVMIAALPAIGVLFPAVLWSVINAKAEANSY